MRNLDEDSTISGSSDFTSSQVRINQSMNLNTIKKSLITSVSLLGKIIKF